MNLVFGTDRVQDRRQVLCVFAGNFVNKAKNYKLAAQKKKMKLIALTLATLLSLTTVAAQSKKPQFDTLRAEGYEALYNLDYEGARKRFQKMVDIEPIIRPAHNVSRRVCGWSV